MTLYSFATLEESPPPQETLAMLALALDGRCVRAQRRVMTSDDSRSPDEGLALLDAYVSITDASIRQAILDAVIAIADTNPYQRSRETQDQTASGPKSSDRGD